MCSTGSPRNVVSDLYSKPQPSHLAFAGNGAPQLGQDIACSEISCRHSLQGLISSALSPFYCAKVVLDGPDDTRETTEPEAEKRELDKSVCCCINRSVKGQPSPDKPHLRPP